jgi:amino acid transporter
VLSSTVATTQTTLLPSSRLTYSMARDGVFPKAFGTIHKSWKTPWVGTIISSVLAIIVIALQTTIDSVGSVFANLILDIGLLVALYYGITGIACAWAFRKVLLTSVSRFIFAGLLPLLGGIYLLGIGYALIVPTTLPLGQSPDWGTSLPILITVLLGIPLVILAAMTARSDFFHEKTVSYVLVNGKLAASQAGGPAMELSGAAAAAALSTPGATADPAADAAAQNRSSNE